MSFARGSVLLWLAACGPIYPQQQATQQDPQQSQPQQGPPDPAPPPNAIGSPSDPYDPARNAPPTLDQWGQRNPRQIGHTGAFVEPPPPQADQAPPPPLPRPATAPVLSGDTQQLLDAHNAARARHCAAPLTWSPQLAAAAAKWANNLRDRDCAFEHSPNNQFGENLAGGTTGYLDPNGVVAMWYGEVSKYSFRNPGFSMETGHFTQVVWRGTSQVGCARATCGKQNQDIWVCEYDPAGNWEGQFPQNVAPVGCK